MQQFHRVVSNRNAAALLLGLHAWLWWKLGVKADNATAWALAGLFAATGAGLLLRWRWARWAGLVLLVLIVGLKLHTLATTGVAWRPAMHAFAFGFVAYQLWRHPDLGIFEEEPETPDSPDAPDAPPLSLVLLRSQPRDHDATALAPLLSAAWGLRITADDPPQDASEGIVGGKPDHLLVAVNQMLPAMFIIHNLDHGYFEEPETIASAVPNLRLAQIIRGHRAWLSVDYLGDELDEKGQAAAYRMIGKAVAVLADDSTMAIYSPRHRRCNLWSADLAPILCGLDPLEVFKHEVKAPVIGVADGEALEAAFAEARARWPEFVAAFQGRTAERLPFLVKAPFTGENGEVEHIWLEVSGLEPGSIHGTLANEPIHTRLLQQGSAVTVPVAEISDWLCLDAQDRPSGNFTHHLVAEVTSGKPPPPPLP